MSPADLPLSLEAGSVIRELGAGEALFEQGDRAAAIYKVESGRLRLVRRTVDDHLVILHTASTRVLRGSLSFRSNLPLRCSRGRTLANSGLPEGEGDVGAPNRPGTRTSVHGPPRQSASGTSGNDGVAQRPLGPGARPSIPATPRRPGPPQYRHRGPASGHCGGDRDNPRSAVSDPRPAQSRRVHRARGISDSTQET